MYCGIEENVLHTYCYELVVQGMEYSHLVIGAMEIDVDDEGDDSLLLTEYRNRVEGWITSER